MLIAFKIAFDISVAYANNCLFLYVVYMYGFM